MQDEIRVHISRRARLNIETKKKNYAHRMVPEYTIEGELDYHLLLENLNDWIGEHLRSSADVLIVQASTYVCVCVCGWVGVDGWVGVGVGVCACACIIMCVYIYIHTHIYIHIHIRLVCMTSIWDL